MVAWRYEIFFLVFNSIFHEWAQRSSMRAGMNSLPLHEGAFHVWELLQQRNKFQFKRKTVIFYALQERFPQPAFRSHSRPIMQRP